MTKSSREPVAIVTPWYGRDLVGGAEVQARQLALSLRDRGRRVEVLTTCARSFAASWSRDHYPAGEHLEDMIVVRRFALSMRDGERFERASARLQSLSPRKLRGGVSPVGEDAERDFVENNIHSDALVEYLREHAERYEAIIFIPYLYGTTLEGVNTCPERSFVVPCLHDEGYAYITPVQHTMHAARGLLFNSVGEMLLAQRIFGPGILEKSTIVGEWIDAPKPAPPTPARIPGMRTEDRRYLLYLGRRDPAKNVDFLVEAFATFRRRQRLSELSLVLAGDGRRSYADRRHGVFDLGYVSDEHREALLHGALAVVQPSLNESFSRTMMEAWARGKPVVAHGRCAVTESAVRQSGGGYVATTKAQWSQTFAEIDTSGPAALDDLGERGRMYFERHGSYETVLTRLERALSVPRAEDRWDILPNAQLARRLGDGRRNVLYAGRFEEASGVELLIAGFAFLLAHQVDARLVLLGSFSDEHLRARRIEQIGESGLAERVVFAESSDPSVVAACWRTADLFWSMADELAPKPEFETAALFGVPVIAYRTTAAHVAAENGVIFTDRGRLDEVAALAKLILSDTDLRARLTAVREKLAVGRSVEAAAAS